MNNWNEQIDAISDEFSTLFSGLSEASLNWKPSPDIWSIAQIMDHLIVINKTYFPVFMDLQHGIHKAHFLARIPFVVRMFGNLILDSVKPGNNKKLKTFPIWEPSTSSISGDIVQLFLDHQKELKRQIQIVAPFVESGAIISSPANEIIVYKLETAFEIIITHEKRHLKQAKEMLELQQSSGEI
ncbi:MAG: DinB family protein [Saprospiraceae bacterium]